MLFPHFACGFFGLWVLYGITRFITMLQGKTVWSASPKWREEAARKRSKTWYKELPARGDLFREIKLAMAEYESKTGKRPKSIYLGQKQWDFLKTDVAGLGSEKSDSKISINEGRFMGCVVLKVDRPDHIAVA